MDNAGVVAESEAVIQKQRNVQRRKTFISDILSFRFIDRHHSFVIRLKYSGTARNNTTVQDRLEKNSKLYMSASLFGLQLKLHDTD